MDPYDPQPMSLILDTKYTLDKAVRLCRILEEALESEGMHCGLQGGVLMRGWSAKDFDISVYPHGKDLGMRVADPIRVMESVGFKFDPERDRRENYARGKTLRHAEYEGYHVDVFFWGFRSWKDDFDEMDKGLDEDVPF